MKAKDVVIGQTYLAKVSGRRVRVTVVSQSDPYLGYSTVRFIVETKDGRRLAKAENRCGSTSSSDGLVLSSGPVYLAGP